MRGSWDILNTDSKPGKTKWLVKGNSGQIPHKSDLNYPEGTTLRVHPCVYPHIPYSFFLLINFSCFTTFCLWGNSFLQRQWARSGHRPLILSLGFGSLTGKNPTSISGQEPKLCFKPLQAKATWCHPQHTQEWGVEWKTEEWFVTSKAH